VPLQQARPDAQHDWPQQVCVVVQQWFVQHCWEDFLQSTVPQQL
jgi:hypothetical protein